MKALCTGWWNHLPLMFHSVKLKQLETLKEEGGENRTPPEFIQCCRSHPNFICVSFILSSHSPSKERDGADEILSNYRSVQLCLILLKLRSDPANMLIHEPLDHFMIRRAELTGAQTRQRGTICNSHTHTHTHAHTHAMPSLTHTHFIVYSDRWMQCANTNI